MEDDKRAFAQGISIGNGEVAKPAKLEILTADEISEISLTIQEGKFHQVKRMFGARGHEVTALHRASFGPLTIPEGMKAGDHVRLSEEQVDLLRKAVQNAASDL